MDDFILLQSFVNERSDAAFGELMRRHVDLVYSAARRRTADAHMAEDVTQAVFLVLARKAGELRRGVVLPAWLLHVTRMTAANALRQRRNQTNIERKAAAMTNESTESTAASAEAARVLPLLDDAMANLAEPDRNALALRYFSRCSLAEVGQRLGVTTAAAEKRVSRATDRLRQMLKRLGVTIGALALAQIVTDSGVSAAPVEFTSKFDASIFVSAREELANRTLQTLTPGLGAYLKPMLLGAAALIMFLAAGGGVGYFVATQVIASNQPVQGAQNPAPQFMAEPMPAPVEPNEEIHAPPPTPAPRFMDTARNNPPVMAAPRVAFTPSETLVPAQGNRVNLLSRVDLAADNLNGEWSQEPGALKSGQYAYSLVQLPYTPPAEYDFHASFKVLEARGEIMMVCSRPGADFGWKMGAHDNKVSIFDITPGYNPVNSSRRETAEVFKSGEHYDVTVQVRNNGVAAYVNGKLSSLLETNYLGLGVFEFWQLKDRTSLGVGTWGTPTEFDTIEVIEFSGPGKVKRGEGERGVPLDRPQMADAATWTKAVDLMPLIDPNRDAVSGLWTRDANGALVSNEGSLARLEIPYKLPEEYDFKIVFTRQSGWDTIAQYIGHGKVNVFWGMAMWGNASNMFRCVNQWEGHNPTTVWAKEFIENGKRFESVVQVRKNGYAAFINGKLVGSWDRGYRDAHVPKSWVLPTPGALGLGVSKCQVVFHSLQLLEVSGAGAPIQVTASKRVEPLVEIPKTKVESTSTATKPPAPPQDGF